MSCPVLITFATALPETLPNTAEESIATLPGDLTYLMMYFIKKSMIPNYTSICPTKTNKKTIPHIIAIDIPNIAVLSMTICDIKSR